MRRTGRSRARSRSRRRSRSPSRAQQRLRSRSRSRSQSPSPRPAKTHIDTPLFTEQFWEQNEEYILALQVENTIGIFGIHDLMHGQNPYTTRAGTPRLDWKYIVDTMAGICNPKSVGFEYAKHSVLGLSEAHMDFLFLMDMGNMRPCGMLVTHLGECELFPDHHALQLICTNKPGMGKVLMGLYLLACKSAEQDRGLLEVANEYRNLPALCLYSKFGFRENLEYRTPSCFTEGLPMECNLSAITSEMIFQVLTGELTSLPADHEYESLCKTKQPEVRQILMDEKMAHYPIQIKKNGHAKSQKRMEERMAYIEKGKEPSSRITRQMKLAKDLVDIMRE